MGKKASGQQIMESVAALADADSRRRAGSKRTGPAPTRFTEGTDVKDPMAADNPKKFSMEEIKRIIDGARVKGTPSK